LPFVSADFLLRGANVLPKSPVISGIYGVKIQKTVKVKVKKAIPVTGREGP
jgi:hypothetical protein